MSAIARPFAKSVPQVPPLAFLLGRESASIVTSNPSKDKSNDLIKSRVVSSGHEIGSIFGEYSMTSYILTSAMNRKGSASTISTWSPSRTTTVSGV